MVSQHSRFVWLFSFALVAGYGLFHPVDVPAQTVSGTILGLIQDQQGAAIGKANVSTRSLDTGAVRTTTSADNGEYRIVSVPAGAYEITVSAPGFKTEVRGGIAVTVGADVGINFAMTVGAVSEKIEVTAEAPQVDTSGSAMGGFVNSATIRELPLNGRDWLQLALLQPGALNNAGTFQADSSRAQKGNGLQISISGGRVTENVFRIDGLVINDYSNAGPGSSLHVNMGVDAIREFSVLTNNYTAEYGRGASGVVNAITKSGTNDFHGSAYYFHRNSALDARNFFDGKNIAPFRRHQFGGAIGGRIKKDKTFFFANYENLREAKGLSTSVDTLSTNAHNGILTSGPVTIDNRMKPYLQFYPFPNAGETGDSGKFAFDAVRIGNEKYVIGKLDHYFSASTTLSASYSYDDTMVTFPDFFNEKFSIAPAGKQNAVLSLQHIFSPSVINNARVGVSRSDAGNNLDCCIKLQALADPTLSFIPGQPVGTFNVTGLINISGTAVWGGIGSSGLNKFYYTAPQFYDDLSWTRGRHSMRMGFGIERVNENLDEQGRPNGLWTFPSIRDMLQAKPSQFSADFPGTDTVRGSRNSIIGAYFQDDFRVLPNLTLNLGVRYDMDTVIKEVNGKLANLRNLTDPATSIGDPYYNNPTFKNFAPRIGFAWDPMKNGKTAIRGGVGMFDIVPLPYLLVNLIPRSAPFFRQGTLNNPPASSFPNQGLGLLALNTLQATRLDFNPSRSYKMQWNLNIQRQLTRSLALTVGYVGSSGIHLAHMIYDYNQVPPSLVTFNGTNYIFPIPAPGTKVQRVNPNFGQIRSIDFQGHSSYHSLQTNLSQRLAKGLTYQIAYTWSKSIDNGTNTTGGDSLNTIQGPWSFCQRCERGPSDFDIPQNLVVNFLYDIPVLAPVKSNKVANTILGGWQVGGIYTRATGGAYNVKLTTDQAFTGSNVASATSGGLRPNYLGNTPGCTPGEVTTGDISHLIKTTCFAFPGPGVLGNLGRGVFRMPVFRNLDFSVFKNQNLRGEQVKLQFRAEMFNILNNTNLTPQSFSNSFTNSGVLIPSFGTPTAPTQNQSRQIQFGLRLLF